MFSKTFNFFLKAFGKRECAEPCRLKSQSTGLQELSRFNFQSRAVH